MMRRGAMAALLLACLAATAAAGPARAQGPSASTHEVRRGDTLFAIARKTRYDGVSRNQMILAIVRANQNVFTAGNIHLLEVGTVLVIPTRESVVALQTAEADRVVREMLAKPPSAQVASVKSAPAVVPPAASARPQGAEEAARRYREGLAHERKGDFQSALKAFLEAGEAGNGLAQRRLGQIYDKGNAATKRDYQASLRWYQKAREQGVEIDKPLPRTTPAK